MTAARRTLPRRSLLLANAALAACSVLPERPYAERRQWPLLVSRPATLPPRPGGAVLQVRAMTAGPGVDQRGLMTRAADGSVAVAHYEEWMVPPADGAEAALRDWLAQSGLFSAVIAPGSRLDAAFVLESQLTAFYADLPALQAHAHIGIALLRISGLTSLPVLQAPVVGLAAMRDASPPAQADAMRAALAAAFADIETAIRGAIA